MDVVSWFLGILKQLWIDDRCAVSCMQNVTMKVRGDQDVAAGSKAKREEESYLVLLCARWFLKRMADWAVRASSCCLIW